MLWLVFGLALWVGLHLMPALAPEWRARRISHMGLKPYKGLFALGVLLSLVLMVVGWRGTLPTYVYVPPTGLRHLSALLMLAAFVLFIASRAPSNIKRFIRHPQLSSIMLWGVAHLMANGDQRALVLFGGMTLWALAEIVLINRRDGAWSKPAPKPISGDIITVLIAIVLYGLFAGLLHRWLFGVSPFGV